MINVKRHTKERYCERILGIKDKSDIKQHIAQNDDKIIDHINRMYEHSQYIYTGQLGDNITRVYHIVDNVVLVLDSQKTCIITLFKCIFDFGEEMDRQIIKHELEKIEKLNKELDAIDSSINEFSDKKKLEASTIEAQIKAMEDQIAILRNNLSFINEEIKQERNARTLTAKELEKRAVRICNSIDYRRDLNEGAI